MSGNQIGSVVGGAIGLLLAPATGGASLMWAMNGMAIGGAVGGLLMPDEAGLQDQHGPRLNDTKVSTTTYGASISKVYGAYRIPGNLIWALPIQETKHVEEVEVGKGGSESYDVISYTYSASFAIALCEGPIAGVRRIWADSELIYDFGTDASAATLDASSQFNRFFTLHKGDPDQAVDWLIQASEPDTPAYRNVAYISFNNLQLEKYGNRIPNITAEVVKTGGDGTYIDMVSTMYVDGTRYLSPIQGKSYFQFDTVTKDVEYFYTNGPEGVTSNSGHIVNSCYFNRDDGRNDIYFTGAWSGNNILKFAYQGRSVHEATPFNKNDTYYFIWRDAAKADAGIAYPYYIDYTIPSSRNPKPNGDTLITYGWTYEAYGGCETYGTWSDSPDVMIRYSSQTATTCITVTGIGDWSYENYVYNLSATDYITTTTKNCMIFAVPFQEFGGVGAYKIIVYKKKLYTFFTQPKDGTVLWMPGVWNKVDYLIDEWETTKVPMNYTLDDALDFYIHDDKIYILSYKDNVSSDFILQVFNLNGTSVGVINLYEYLTELDEPYKKVSGQIYLVTSESFKIQVSDKSIVLIIKTTSKHQVIRLEGDPRSMSTIYKTQKIGEFPLSSVPDNWNYSVEYGPYLRRNGFYNEDTKTLKMSYSWNQVEIYFGVLSNSGMTLSAIVTDLLLSCGIDSNNIDTTEGLSTTVEGFYIEDVSSPRSAIATLQSIYLFDLVEEDFTIKIKMRESSSLVAGFTEDDLILNENVEIKSQIDTELPKKVTLSYANNKRDYLKGAQSSLRIDGNSDNNVNQTLPIAFTDTEAKNLTEKLIMSAWTQKTKVSFSVPITTDVSLSDIVTLDYKGVTYTLRVSSIIYAGYLIQLACLGENLENYSTFAIGEDTTEGFTPSDVDIARPSEMLLYNSPTLSNSFIDSFGVYYSASGYPGWKGASIVKSKDFGQTYLSVNSIINNIPIGQAYSVLPGPTSVWDLENTIRLRCINGDKLVSITEDQVLSGGNYIIIGHEVLQFQNVTMSGDDYIISKLLRGRRGTEWAVDSHTEREFFSFLNPDIEFSTSTLNVERYYKAVTFGTYVDQAVEVKHTYDGTNLKPFAPDNLEVNNGVITWVRRDRYISGYFRTLPNSEAQEKYKLEFFYQGALIYSVELVDVRTFTYDPIAHPDIDTIQVSQYSDNLLEYGYLAEITYYG